MLAKVEKLLSFPAIATRSALSRRQLAYLTGHAEYQPRVAALALLLREAQRHLDKLRDCFRSLVRHFSQVSLSRTLSASRRSLVASFSLLPLVASC